MNFKRVCAVGDVPENTLKKFDVDGITVVVANYGGGHRGFPPFCPHMEEPLEESGMLAGGMLTCSKHLWQWDLSSGDLIGETEKALLFYDLKQEGDDILINVETELAYDYDEEDDFDGDDFFNAD
ncbi:MAG: Rieske 2Fe-2S domain-containing protein [Proteobacteria bacterium]|nr:Rieske 2Fe-2S domain-containing protein [Pseudomonadota bacterium]MDA1024309.1 Rieske 2Fe-2S domain-containing protein [Pseudomonadota bacterium]